jgi:ribosome-associated protein
MNHAGLTMEETHDEDRIPDNAIRNYDSDLQHQVGIEPGIPVGRTRFDLMRLGRASRSTLGKRRQASIPEETTIAIRDEYITLQQLLKMAGVIGTGGEAKIYLAETAVMVNGEPEQRRGRKLRPGDLIVAPGAAPIRLMEQVASKSKEKP